MRFKIGANRFNIKFCIKNCNFFQICRRFTKNSSQTLKSGLKFSGVSDLQPQNWKVLQPKYFLRNRPGIVWVTYGIKNFDSNPLTCDRSMFPAKNNLNSAKSKRIFAEWERGDITLILAYLDRLMVEVFLINFGHPREETGSQS